LEIETRLDYISRQLEQLRIVERLPHSDVSAQALINSAMDVQSAVMNYIAIQIRHQSGSFGIVGIPKTVQGSLTLGKTATTFVKGDELGTAGTKLENAVGTFNSALSHFGHGVGFKTFDTVEGKHPAIIDGRRLIHL
jgi:hypothetical protein